MPTVADAVVLHRYANEEGGLDGVWVPLAEGSSVATCEALIADWLAGWRNLPSVQGPALVMTEVGQMRAIGHVGLRDRGDRVVELVYGVAPDQRGHGYASRAARLVARWLLDEGLAREVELRIGEGHAESLRVAGNAGFALAGTVVSRATGTGESFHDRRFVLLRPEGDAPTIWQPPAVGMVAASREEPLRGGRVTPGVVRVGDTVRRPHGPHSAFVGELLEDLARAGFGGAPLRLGVDEQGRDVLSFVPGEVPRDLGFFSDEQLVAAFELLRCFHDFTAGSPLRGDAEVVCHGDVSPCNTVFRNGQPIALIDFDTAAPGRRVDDLGYGLFLWLDLGNEDITLDEQRRRLEVATAAYGIAVDGPLISEILEQVALTAERLRLQMRESAAWWQQMHRWLLAHAGELAR
jgi:RimJ/RimL family protein N-acetyltransferase